MKKNMIISIIILVILLIVGGYLFSAYPQKGMDSIGVPPSVKLYNGEMSELIIELEDLPEGYEFLERSPRIKSEVSDVGQNWGWVEGYHVGYIKQGEGLFDISTIHIFSSKYPLENISKNLEDMPEEYEGYTVAQLPNPNIGEGSYALKYTDEEMGLSEYQIEFMKKDIYIRLDMYGLTDYELLKELAEMIEAKI